MKTFALKKDDHAEAIGILSSQELSPLYIDDVIPLENSINAFCKRSFDLIASSILLICFFSWAFPIIALFIKLDSKGTIFFLQKRNKRNGGFFTCIKFRTMIVNDKADLLAVEENDLRITRAGYFLRKHHLDELPQLFNVLLGDMSLIGPRPYMISDNEKYEKLIRNYLVRQKIKPGITGLAQVIDYVNPITNVDSMKQRVDKDLYYIYNWSLLLDAKILFRTFLKIFGVNSR